MADKTQEAGRLVMVTFRVMIDSIGVERVPELQEAIYRACSDLPGVTVDVNMRAPRAPIERSR